MTKSDEIVRELEKFYCHDAEVFNRDDDRFFVAYAPIFQIVSSDGGLLSVTNDVRFGTDYMKALKTARMGAIGSRSRQGLGSRQRSRNDHSGHNPPQGRQFGAR
jgi:hypothetical protein